MSGFPNKAGVASPSPTMAVNRVIVIFILVEPLAIGF
jgi:hypothetical protein